MRAVLFTFHQVIKYSKEDGINGIMRDHEKDRSFYNAMIKKVVPM